ncbi:MAG: NADP-dependent oxidoreductase [Pseudomonadales bacterium]
MPLGSVMRARGAGEVVESDDPGIPVGTLVFGFFGMQDYALVEGRSDHFRLCPPDADLAAELGVQGGTGLTAYFGLLDVVVVRAAAGATGSVVCQLARIKGCRVIGIAGSDHKCRWLAEIGVDGTINYKRQSVAAELDRMLPGGLDIHFDNVGGATLDAYFDRLRLHGRVVLCGGISHYDDDAAPPGPRNCFQLVFRRARMEGFLLSDYAHRFDAALDDMRGWLEAGALHNRATVMGGFAQLPAALVALFEGRNVGKMLVEVA